MDGYDPFYKIKKYGSNIPNPKFKYIELPDKIKPVTTKRPISALKVLTGYELERTIKDTWLEKKEVFNQIWSHNDPQYGMVDFVHDVLAPDPDSSNVRIKERRTLFIGISLTATRDELRKAFDNLLIKYVRQKTGVGDSKPQPSKWKSGIMIWDMRIFRLSFAEAARKIGINKDTAKKQFYSVYKLIYGKKYKVTDFEKPNIKKEYLKGVCDSCPRRRTCKDLCPDVFAYVEQDEKKYQKKEVIEAWQKITDHKKMVNYTPQTQQEIEDELIDKIDSSKT